MPARTAWFSESQFESYRALGAHITDQLTRELAGSTNACFADFYSSVQAYLATSPTVPGAA